MSFIIEGIHENLSYILTYPGRCLPRKNEHVLNKT